jgi:hypothetical protein
VLTASQAWSAISQVLCSSTTGLVCTVCLTDDFYRMKLHLQGPIWPCPRPSMLWIADTEYNTQVGPCIVTSHMVSFNPILQSLRNDADACWHYRFVGERKCLGHNSTSTEVRGKRWFRVGDQLASARLRTSPNFQIVSLCNSSLESTGAASRRENCLLKHVSTLRRKSWPWIKISI